MLDLIIFLATFSFIVWVLVHTKPKCQHLNTRCIHGDEGWDRMKVYMRWWKEPIIRRQSCLECGAALDRDPICSTNPGQHIIIKKDYNDQR